MRYVTSFFLFYHRDDLYWRIVTHGTSTKTKLLDRKNMSFLVKDRVWQRVHTKAEFEQLREVLCG